MTRIAIIGAGPTWLSLAAFLTHMGVKVEVFEKNKKTTKYSKAMIMHARSLEAFDDVGIADSFVKEGEHLTSVKILNISQNKPLFDFNKIGKGLTKFPDVLTIEQSKTESILVEHLQQSWVTINRSHEITSITPKGKKQTLSFANGKNYDADYVVGCDWARSFVRHYLKLPFGWSTVQENFFVADAIIQSKKINKKEIYISFGDKQFCMLFPIDAQKNHYRIIGMVPRHFDDIKKLTFAMIQKEVIENLSLPITIVKTNRFSTYHVHSRYSSFGDGHILLAGDACHIHTPAGGRGMNTGIQDAYNLAWKLAMVSSWKADKKLLSTYNQERYPVAQELIHSTDRLFGYVNSNKLFSFFFRTVIIRIAALIVNLWLFRKKIFPLLGMLDIAYAKSDAITPSTLWSIESGQRLPYVPALYEKLRQKWFIILDCNVRLEDAPCEVMNIDDCFWLKQSYLILVRPDKHIAYIGNDAQQIKKYFAQREVKKNKTQ